MRLQFPLFPPSILPLSCPKLPQWSYSVANRYYWAASRCKCGKLSWCEQVLPEKESIALIKVYLDESSFKKLIKHICSSTVTLDLMTIVQPVI